ncbi:MAG: restriction endonuclease [Campylobacteraceae bacterium]|nr:restriction endonuclease [Campylobacteraceae bacterium]
MNLPYDKTCPKSIEQYSQKLINHSFRDVLAWYFKNQNELENKIKELNKNNKGGLGNLIEEYFFLKKPDNKAEADFKEAGVELKVTPYEIKKDGSYAAGERLVLSMIPYDKNIEKEFFESDIYDKIKLMLLILYLRDREIPRLDYKIGLSKLFRLVKDLNKNDLNIIIEDYNKISQKIQDGLAHKLSEGDTMYLGACTKSSDSSKTKEQYNNIKNPAKPRAFSLKTKFMSNLINNFFEKKEENEAIFKTYKLDNQTFEEKVINKLSKFYGKDEIWLKDKFKITSKAKHLYSILTLQMLGVKSDNALEFEKAGIEIKAIRIEENGKIIESMSFPSFKIKEFVKESFEESNLYNFFSESKFLFVCFKKTGETYKFIGAKFWNMPTDILEKKVKKEWNLYQKAFRYGIEFQMINNKVYNNLPKSSDTKIIHIRPHAIKSAYHIINSAINTQKPFIKGNLERDGDTLPNGDIMTKQCFWLNNDFVASLVSELR